MLTPLASACTPTGKPFKPGARASPPFTGFEDIEAFSSRIGGQVDDFNPQDFIDAKEVKKMDLFMQYAWPRPNWRWRTAGSR